MASTRAAILFKRCMDMNDRALRNTIVGLGGKANGVPREDGFQITVASEVMAILCLAADLQDLKERLGNILVAYTYDNKPVYAKDLKVNGAMAVLLKDAIKPNLVQTLENTPALMHGGPFANIAHGCNSVQSHQAGAETCRLHHHRGGLRFRPWRRKIPGHQVPLCGHRAVGHRGRRHPACAQI